MYTCRCATSLQCDGREKCFLAERFVITDVVDLSYRPLVVHSQEQPLYYVRDIDERHGVIAGANDDTLASACTISYSPEVQMVAWAEDRGWPYDDSRKL